MKLMTHAVIGYPTQKDTIDICERMEHAGSDMIELQIPFSDPLADGPVILQACQKALDQGITIDDCFTVITDVSKKVSIPLACMAYFQTVFTYGFERFCIACQRAGVTSLIIPDIPIDEDDYRKLQSATKKSGLNLVAVISPSIDTNRLKTVLKMSTGFVYCTSRIGITGTHATLDSRLNDCLQTVRSLTTRPIAVGFGISKLSHVRALSGQADIAVVGSALIERIEKDGIQSVNGFIQELATASTQEHI